jgi:hypothetical protein
MTFTILFLILCVVLVGTAAANVSGVDYDPPDIGNLIPPKTVDSVDVTAFMGRWYLMYTSLIPVATYLQGGLCLTADYFGQDRELGKPTFRVVNSMRFVRVLSFDCRA